MLRENSNTSVAFFFVFRKHCRLLCLEAFKKECPCKNGYFEKRNKPDRILLVMLKSSRVKNTFRKMREKLKEISINMQAMYLRV